VAQHGVVGAYGSRHFPPSVSDPADSRAHQIHGFFASRAVRTHSRWAEGEARNARTTFHTM
jgi:hypothetical protein